MVVVVQGCDSIGELLCWVRVKVEGSCRQALCGDSDATSTDV